MQGIYRIRNKINDKRYVGSTQDFDERWGIHRDELRRGNHYNPHLQNAWNKYGEENFAFEIEEEIENGRDLLSVEQGYLDEGFELGILYNIARKAGGGNLGEEVNEKIGRSMSRVLTGVPKSKEHRANLSKALTGQKIHTEEWKQEQSERMSGENNPMYGKPGYWLGKKNPEQSKRMSGKNNPNYGGLTEDHKDAISRAKTGYKHTEETKAKISKSMSGENNPNYGKPCTEETKAKISMTLIGRKHTEEHNAKISKALSGENNPMYGKKGEDHPAYGYRHTEKAKARMSEIQMGHEVSEKTRVKIGEAQAKPYPAFYNVNTKQFIPNGRNLFKFCKKCKVSYDALCSIKQGNTKQSRKGWRLATEDEIKELGGLICYQ